MKSCLITALVLIVIGAVISIIIVMTKGGNYLNEYLASRRGGTVVSWMGRLLGRYQTDYDYDYDYNYDYDYDYGLDYDYDYDFSYEWETGIIDNYDINEQTIFTDEAEILSGNIGKYPVADSSVAKLDIELGGCTFDIVYSDDDSFYIEGTNTGKFQIYQKGSTLHVKGVKTTTEWNEINKCTITLYVPKDYTYQDFVMEFGAGTVTIEKLDADKADITIGAGQVTIDEFTVSDACFEVGAGYVELNTFEVEKLKVIIGAGGFSGSGSISQKGELECVAGSISLNLDGSQDDYNYNMTSVAGAIDLNGHSYSGLAMEREIDNNANKKLQISCSVGNVEITF